MGEFNTYADAVAAARVFALTSPNPQTTLPPTTSVRLPPYPKTLSRPLTLRLFPLDITLRHNISRGAFRKTVSPLVDAGSPLAEWVSAFMGHTFRTMERLHHGHVGDDAELSLHDPVCVWYALTAEDPHWTASDSSPEDIRVETQGQWTRGMCVVDRRSRHRVESDEESSSDHGLWLNPRAGNRILRMHGSPAETTFGQILLQKLFG
jgi:inosine-uridine nucleoside N-ribohydrolase